MVVAMELQIETRWMLRRDMAAVCAIEEECFDHPWQEEDFCKVLRETESIGTVAEIDGCVAGYMIYGLSKRHIELLAIAVFPSCQGLGVGTHLVNRLKHKLAPDRRYEIELMIRERNLEAQLFFKAQGFLAEGIIHSPYEGCGEDAYLMTYRCEVQSE